MPRAAKPAKAWGQEKFSRDENSLGRRGRAAKRRIPANGVLAAYLLRSLISISPFESRSNATAGRNQMVCNECARHIAPIT